MFLVQLTIPLHATRRKEEDISFDCQHFMYLDYKDIAFVYFFTFFTDNDVNTDMYAYAK